jgi:uncharacterized coiled-coil protein SlyX
MAYSREDTTINDLKLQLDQYEENYTSNLVDEKEIDKFFRTIVLPKFNVDDHQKLPANRVAWYKECLNRGKSIIQHSSTTEIKPKLQEYRSILENLKKQQSDKGPWKLSVEYWTALRSSIDSLKYNISHLPVPKKQFAQLQETVLSELNDVRVLNRSKTQELEFEYQKLKTIMPQYNNKYNIVKYIHLYEDDRTEQEKIHAFMKAVEEKSRGYTHYTAISDLCNRVRQTCATVISLYDRMDQNMKYLADRFRELENVELNIVWGTSPLTQEYIDSWEQKLTLFKQLLLGYSTIARGHNIISEYFIPAKDALQQLELLKKQIEHGVAGANTQVSETNSQIQSLQQQVKSLQQQVESLQKENALLKAGETQKLRRVAKPLVVSDSKVSTMVTRSMFAMRAAATATSAAVASHVSAKNHGYDPTSFRPSSASSTRTAAAGSGSAHRAASALRITVVEDNIAPIPIKPVL